MKMFISIFTTLFILLSVGGVYGQTSEERKMQEFVYRANENVLFIGELANQGGNIVGYASIILNSIRTFKFQTADKKERIATGAFFLLIPSREQVKMAPTVVYVAVTCDAKKQLLMNKKKEIELVDVDKESMEGLMMDYLCRSVSTF